MTYRKSFWNGFVASRKKYLRNELRKDPEKEACGRFRSANGRLRSIPSWAGNTQCLSTGASCPTVHPREAPPIKPIHVAGTVTTLKRLGDRRSDARRRRPHGACARWRDVHGACSYLASRKPAKKNLRPFWVFLISLSTCPYRPHTNMTSIRLPRRPFRLRRRRDRLHGRSPF